MTQTSAKNQTKSSESTMFACAGAAASILIIRALSISLSVLLVLVLFGVLLSLVLLRRMPKTEPVS